MGVVTSERMQPTQWDKVVEVPAPGCCPHCGGVVHSHPHLDSYDHVQEDVVYGRRQVVLYRHVAARCMACRNWVKQPGEGELLGSKVGPHARAMAAFLHNEIGVSARKVPRAVEGLTQLAFTPAALLGFETKLARRAKSLVDDIASKISSTDGAVNADETYWSLGGKRAYYWIHAAGRYIHFRFSMSRAGKISRQVLGDDFSGVLVTDCYSGYDAHTARAKQKCLAHLTRTARDWQKVVLPDSRAWQFFEDIQTWVTRGCRLHRLRNTLTSGELAVETNWLRQEQQRLETTACTAWFSSIVPAREKSSCNIAESIEVETPQPRAVRGCAVSPQDAARAADCRAVAAIPAYHTAPESSRNK